MKSTSVLSLAFCGAVAQASAVQKDGSSVILPLATGRLKVQACADNIIHVVVSPRDSFSARPSLMAARDKFTPVACEIREEAASVTLSTAGLRVVIDRPTGRVTFQDSSGRVLLAEQGRTIEPVQISDGQPAWKAGQNFTLAADEALYGLGQFQQRQMNWRGKEMLLKQFNTQVSLPMILSTGGWGLLWDNNSETTFKDGPEGMSLKSLAVEQEDYWFIAGNPDTVVAGMREITGSAPLFGKWAYGYWQCKERYFNQAELLQIASEFRARRIPVDNLVQDWNYWIDDAHWSSMEWESQRYPDPKGMLEELHRKHFHLMISIWPALGHASNLRRDMAKKGWMLNEPKDKPGLYDPFNPGARDLYWDYVSKNLWSLGMDAWWLDASEPEISADEFQRFKTHLGSGARVQNAFALEHVRGVFEHQRAASSRKRVFILTRNGFPGQQRYAASTWSGDIVGTWQTLRNQVPAGLNFCMAGVPYWTTDIGGFSMVSEFLPFKGEINPGVQTEAYRELYTRWFQYAAFCPLFRSHGTNTPREPWQFGEPGTPFYDTILRFDRLRYRLLPYIYSLAWKVTSEGFTMMRGLAMDFGSDPKVHSIADQFMFGHELLVNPVLNPMYSRLTQADPIPEKNLFTKDGKPGLEAEYFKGESFDESVRKAVDKQVDFNWGAGSPEGLPNDHFSARWTGQIKSAEAGEYTILTTSDDGVRMWLDNKLVIDNWTNHSASLDRTIVQLKARTRYDIKLEYFESTGDAVIKLQWITPADKARVPRPVPKEREVYLPQASWFDFWTGKTEQGGRSISAAAPLEILPLYVKAGSILCLGPELEYSDEKPADPIELRIYPGADGSFTLYEDQGDGYDYEKGVYALIPLAWNDKAQTLTIGARQGSFPGMPAKRTFNVVLVGAGQGTGLEVSARPDRTVQYEGKALTVNFSFK